MAMIMLMITIMLIILSLLSKTKLPLSARDTIKNYQNFLAKDLKDQFIGMSIKQKFRIKIQQMNIDIFLNQILLKLIIICFSLYK